MELCLKLALAYLGTPVEWWLTQTDERLIATAVDLVRKD